MKRMKSTSKTNTRANFFFSEKDIIELRQEFWVLFKEEPKSYRAYSREIGIGKVGQVLSDFLCVRRGTTDCTLMKIRNYLDSKKSS